MEQVIGVVREMVRDGCTLSEVIDYLRSESAFVLTPFNLLRLIHDAFGASLTQVRPLIELFDADMNPIVQLSELDRAGDAVLGPYRPE